MSACHPFPTVAAGYTGKSRLGFRLWRATRSRPHALRHRPYVRPLLLVFPRARPRRVEGTGLRFVGGSPMSALAALAQAYERQERRRRCLVSDEKVRVAVTFAD